MKSITHLKQRRIWDEEHRNPYVLLQMDSSEPSGGVVRFIDWLKKKNKVSGLTALELGCGKGRNVIWLAGQGLKATGFDFSPTAIQEARARAKSAGVSDQVNFMVADATNNWPFDDQSFNLVIDCFASTDIESKRGREFASKEMARVLKPKGYLLVYALSPDDQFHKEMIKISPTKEKNAFLHPTTGKFEKTFDHQELVELHEGLKLVKEDRVNKTTTFFGKEYSCLHFWMIFQKPR